MRLIFGSDHAGYELKQYLCSNIRNLNNVDVLDMGCYDNNNKYDYPDIAKNVCNELLTISSKFEGKILGILICGTGVGISIAANKIEDIRCALCHNKETAEMSRRHNNANVLALGGRILKKEDALSILMSFMTKEFDGGRHKRRLSKLKHIKNIFK